MSAYSRQASSIATKLVTSYPNNISCPKIQSTVLLHRPEDGRLLALMSGEHITACRTAAASVVAACRLAPSCQVLAVLGSGVQARSHAQAFVAADCGVEEVRISARNAVAATQLTSSLADEFPGVRFVYYESARLCVDGADVINTTTASPDPILMDNWVGKDGVHINVVGGRVPHKTELEPALLRRATVYTDSREGAASEMGPINVDIYGEVGEVLNETLPVKSGGVTAFLSFGMAVEDVVAARLVWDSYCASQSPC
ncbi:ketimine reductase mu-crystallin-like isoform X2 [Pollicipes pollicipes]|nr:ketimine reductase mu-crystallin-like isoform X2 [Pollicipes pollicipes]